MWLFQAKETKKKQKFAQLPIEVSHYFQSSKLENIPYLL